jgi:hypothetical protein
MMILPFLAKEDVASSSLVTRFCPLVPRGYSAAGPAFASPQNVS